MTDPGPDRPPPERPPRDRPRREGPWRDGAPGERRWRRSADRPRPPRHGLGLVGCLFGTLILFIGVITALATWVAGALLGIISPDAAPSSLTTVAVIVVVAFAIVLGARAFGSAVRPLAELATATARLADGEAEVRVRPRGPRSARSLVTSFNAMAERLDRARADRQALLADVTHELRTPLTVIAGGLEAMLDGVHPLDGDHLAPILAETRVMDRLLDDLRTLSLAEAGALTLHREPVDLRELAADIVAAQRPGATAAGTALEVTGDEHLEADVDPVRVREILVNLVVNALRHTPAGGTITVDTRHDGDDAVLTVSDTGDGIAPADLDRVFTRFHRRSDSGGSGLGLTIARDLAAAHGGTIVARSDGIPGHGAAFTVRLPRRD
jgi:signal transduction histidine kinase